MTMFVEFRSMLEFGAYLLFSKSSFQLMLRHPYFGVPQDGAAPVDWIRELHQAGDNVTYMNNITAWYGTQLPLLLETFRPQCPAVPVSAIGEEFLSGEVSELQLLRNRYSCIQAPASATSHWMKVLATCQVTLVCDVD